MSRGSESETKVSRDAGVALVTGVGPGLGAALCRKLCNQGYAVAGMARSRESCAELAKELEQASGQFRFYESDVADPVAMAKTIRDIEAEMGPVSIFIHNAAQLLIKPFVEMTPEEFENIWRVACFGAMVGSREVIPNMLKSGEGTIIFTGATASIRGGAKFGAFASAKFAVRGLAQSLAREHGKLGIHVAHVVIDGVIWGHRAEHQFGMAKEACLDPDVIADTYLQLIDQDSSCWTQEIDIRPSTENY